MTVSSRAFEQQHSTTHDRSQHDVARHDGAHHALHQVAPRDSDKSLGTLLRDLSDGSAQLVRQEIRLARIETAESLHKLGGGAAQMAIALVLAVSAAGAAVAGLILLLSQYALGGRTWLAALVVAAVLGIIAWVCVRRGMRLISPSTLIPTDTTSSITETAAWLRHPTKSDGSSR